MNTPVSALPLPMETKEENILVKMEGNAEVIHMTWRIPEEATARVKKKTSTTLGAAITQKTADDDAKYEWTGSGSGAFGWSTANPVKNYRTLDDSGVSNDVVKFLISSFEGRDIQDEFYLSIPEKSYSIYNSKKNK